MPRGGKRAGAGKLPGTVNKFSAARRDQLIEQGKRLPPEDLLLLAELYAGMAARYQPTNTNPDTGDVDGACLLCQLRLQRRDGDAGMGLPGCNSERRCATCARRNRIAATRGKC
jgi:hypothetical protein